MKTLEFKNKFRDICTDSWDDALDAWFEVAGRLHTRRIVLPQEWKYEPAMYGTPCRKESRFFSDFKNTDTKELKNIGKLLYKYLLLLQSKGLKP